MQNLRFLFVVFLILTSCKEKAKQTINAETEKESKEVSLRKTYAEIAIKEGGHWEGTKYVGSNTFKNVDFLRAPDSLTDHSYYIRYEGPGWESNKVGYRIYLDWRNAIDIFGKKVDTMVLSKVGLDNYDSYHEDSPWGLDILKAGNSLGIGSYGRYDGQVTHHFKKVDSTTARVSNTADNSTVEINYYGWESKGVRTDLKTKLAIVPDSRMTKATLKTSNEIKGLTTGIVKFEDIDLIKSTDGTDNWAYIATYGEQTIVPDNLGMAIFYKKTNLEKMVDGEFDHLLVFKATTAPIDYYFLGAWEQEKDGLKTQEEFLSYLDQLVQELNANDKL